MVSKYSWSPSPDNITTRCCTSWSLLRITRCICCGTPSAWLASVSGSGVCVRVGWCPRPPPRPRRHRHMHPPGVSRGLCVTGPAAPPCSRHPWLRCSISASGAVRCPPCGARCSPVPVPSSCCPSSLRPLTRPA
eukprot:scaffold127844_cov63-Phaeocystis_antarctica.AAC.3